jgi:hypothetical protein
MDKKVAKHVATFLLLNGAFKMGNKDIYLKAVIKYTHGEMRVKGMINTLPGLNNGS